MNSGIMHMYKPKPRLNKKGEFVVKINLKPEDCTLQRTLEEVLADPTTMDKLIAENGAANNKVNLIGKIYNDHLEVIGLTDAGFKWICYCHRCHRKNVYSAAQLSKRPICGCSVVRRVRTRKPQINLDLE